MKTLAALLLTFCCSTAFAYGPDTSWEEINANHLDYSFPELSMQGHPVSYDRLCLRDSDTIEAEVPVSRCLNSVPSDDPYVRNRCGHWTSTVEKLTRKIHSQEQVCSTGSDGTCYGGRTVTRAVPTTIWLTFYNRYDWAHNEPLFEKSYTVPACN
jgi:hypothetical protein